MSETLRPCPLCGGKATLHTGSDFTKSHYFVRCTVCSASTAIGLDEMQVRAGWNRRFIDKDATGDEETPHALALAERLLDVPGADPDDDMRVLSRQLLRQTERLIAARALTTEETP